MSMRRGGPVEEMGGEGGRLHTLFSHRRGPSGWAGGAPDRDGRPAHPDGCFHQEGSVGGMSQDEPAFLHGKRGAERTKLQRAANRKSGMDGMHMSRPLWLGSQSALILPPATLFGNSTCVPPDLRHMSGSISPAATTCSGHDLVIVLCLI